MNEPKNPYRPPVIRSTYDGAPPSPPKTIETIARSWTIATWLVLVVAIAVGSCGGALGSALAFLLRGRP